ATPGLVTEMSIANGNPYFLVATKQLGLYFQDDWKTTNRLILSLGLRWDKDFNLIGGSDVKNSRTYQELVAINSPITNPYISKVAQDDNKDFSPRVGLAYDLTGRGNRSEEHTSELQSLAYLVCRLLLEKKKASSDHELSKNSAT